MGGQWVGVGPVGGCLLSLTICVSLCKGVCVCVCVCVCLCVFVPGGEVQGNVCGCGDFVACIGGVGVALLPVSCKNGTKFAQNSYEIRTNSSPKRLNIRTVNVVVTKFVRNLFELHTNSVRSLNNLHEFVSILCREQKHPAHSTQHSNTTTTQKNNTVESSATVTNEEQHTVEAQQAASKTTIPTQPKSRHYTHIMTISSNEHKRQKATNYKHHKSIVPHDSTTGSHPSNHPHPPIVHSTKTQQQHRRTTQSGH